jgi:hypothetical protein
MNYRLRKMTWLSRVLARPLTTLGLALGWIGLLALERG